MRTMSPAVLSARMITLGLLGGAFIAACSGVPNPGSAGSPPDPDGGVVLVLGGPDAGSSSPDSNEPGSSCTQQGVSVACWTGPANMRNVGTCHDGAQTCSTGEVPVWGQCIGEELTCGEQTPVDAGHDAGSIVDANLPSTCTPVESKEPWTANARAWAGSSRGTTS